MLEMLNWVGSGVLMQLTLAESNRLHNLKANVLAPIKWTRTKTGKFQIALERFQQSLQIAVERKDKFRQESTLGRIGRVYESVGEYSIALEYCQRALKLCIEIGHKRNQIFHLSNLGLIYENMNDYDPAMDHYAEALAIARELGSKKTIGSNLGVWQLLL